MKTYYCIINLQTLGKYQFADLTEQISEIVEKSGINCGIINIVSRHTTTAVLVNEKESLLLKDFINAIEKLFPRDTVSYQHDNIELRKKMCPELPSDECQNADAHCCSIFLTNFQTLNIIDGKLNLGRWQNILFLELDRAKEREISVMVMGI